MFYLLSASENPFIYDLDSCTNLRLIHLRERLSAFMWLPKR